MTVVIIGHLELHAEDEENRCEAGSVANLHIVQPESQTLPDPSKAPSTRPGPPRLMEYQPL